MVLIYQIDPLIDVATDELLIISTICTMSYVYMMSIMNIGYCCHNLFKKDY